MKGYFAVLYVGMGTEPKFCKSDGKCLLFRSLNKAKVWAGNLWPESEIRYVYIEGEPGTDLLTVNEFEVRK